MSIPFNLQIFSLNVQIAYGFIFGPSHLFFRNPDPSDQCDIFEEATSNFNCSQESPQLKSTEKYILATLLHLQLHAPLLCFEKHLHLT